MPTTGSEERPGPGHTDATRRSASQSDTANDEAERPGAALDLSGETPSPDADRFVLEATVGPDGFGGTATFWVRDGLVSAAELLTLFVGGCMVTVTAWGICHVEALPAWVAVATGLAAGVGAIAVGRHFLLASTRRPQHASEIEGAVS
jgi:hypothetical protein